MIDTYIYAAHPMQEIPMMGFIVAGAYAGGKVTELVADQFVNIELYQTVLMSTWKKDPVGHVCETCADDCGNVHCLGYCGAWEPIEGTVFSRWG